MLDGAAGLGIFAGNVVEAGHFRFFVRRIHCVGRNTGLLVTVVVIKKGEVSAVYCHVVLAGRLFIFGKPEFVTAAGKLPNDLVFPFTPVKTKNGI